MKISLLMLAICLLVISLYMDDSNAWRRRRFRFRLRSGLRRLGGHIRSGWRRLGRAVKRIADVCKPSCKLTCSGGKCGTGCNCGFGRKRRGVNSAMEKFRVPFPSKFTDYDHDGNGKISAKEFAVTLKSTLEDSQTAFLLADKNGDGYIDTFEFVLAPFDMTEKEKVKEADNIDVKNEEELQELIDDGLVDLDELEQEEEENAN